MLDFNLHKVMLFIIEISHPMFVQSICKTGDMILHSPETNREFSYIHVRELFACSLLKLVGCPFNGPLSGTKYPTRAASPIQNASTPKSSLPFSKHRSCALLCAGFSRTLH